MLQIDDAFLREEKEEAYVYWHDWTIIYWDVPLCQDIVQVQDKLR